MSAAELSLGFVELAISTLAVTAASWGIARRAWSESLLASVTATLVITISVAVLLLELVGSAGLLQPLAVLGSSVTVWIIGHATLRGRHGRTPASGVIVNALEASRSTPALAAVTAGAAMCVLLLAVGITSVLEPRPQFDALSGHLPVAVQWLQSASTRILPYVSPVSYTARFPANSELLTAWLMLPLHRDVLAQLGSIAGVSMAIAGTTLLARGLGARRGSAALSGLIVVTMPRYLGQLVGTGMQDMLALGALAAATAFIARYCRHGLRRDALVAGLAAGLAIGTRYAAALMLVGPAILMLDGAAHHGGRRRSGIAAVAIFAVGGVATGGYWYARNALLTGDPLYPQPVPWHAAADILGLIPNNRSYITLGIAPAHWWDAARAALQLDGPMLLALVAMAVAAPLLWPRNADLGRRWSLLPAVQVMAFLVTPGSAGYEVGGKLGLQAENLRYLLLALPFCAAAGAALLARARGQTEEVVVGVVAVVAAGSSVLMLRTHIPTTALVAASLGVGAVAVKAFRPGWVPAVRHEAWWAGALVVLLAGAVAMPALADHHDDRREAVGMPYARAAARLSRGPVAFAGFCQSYALYGTRLSTAVEYLTGDDRAVERALATDPKAWLASLREHRVTQVVVGEDICFAGVPVPQRGWAAADRQHFVPFYTDKEAVIYRFVGDNQ
ncbi:MAG: hypothetical protein ACR2MY_05035 [Candidatus Dormibacteria bacterium]